VLPSVVRFTAGVRLSPLPISTPPAPMLFDKLKFAPVATPATLAVTV
jgi:hypothetical protein